MSSAHDSSVGRASGSESEGRGIETQPCRLLSLADNSPLIISAESRGVRHKECNLSLGHEVAFSGRKKDVIGTYTVKTAYLAYVCSADL